MVAALSAGAAYISAKENARVAQAALQEAEESSRRANESLKRESSALAEASNQRDIAKQIAEEAEASEQEALEQKERADQQAAIAEQKAREAVLAAKQAEAQKVLAVEKQKQADAANARGVLIREGLEAFQRKDFSRALEFFTALQEALKTEQSRHLVIDYGWTLSHLGAAYDRVLNYEAAIRSYEEARTVLERELADGSARILVETYDGLARAYHTSGQLTKSIKEERFKKAEEFYKKAIAEDEKRPLPSRTVARHSQLARLYTDMGRLTQAEKSFKDVIEFSQTWEPSELDEALRELANFYRDQGRYGDAAQTYNRLIDLHYPFSDQTAEPLADDYSELGEIYSALKDEERARSAFHLAHILQQMLLEMNRSVADQDVRLDSTFDELGDAFVKVGRFREAQRSYQWALGIRQRGKRNELWKSYEKLAALHYTNLKDYKEAEHYYKLLSEARKDEDEYAAAQAQLGNFYANELNNPAEAEQALYKAYTPLDQRGAWKEVDEILCGLSHAPPQTERCSQAGN